MAAAAAVAAAAAAAAATAKKVSASTTTVAITVYNCLHTDLLAAVSPLFCFPTSPVAAAVIV